MSNDFDFGAFMSKVSNPQGEDAKELLREAVSDSMDEVMGEVAPRLWCILQEQMRKDPTNAVHLNAVMNSAIFSLLSWIIACTPPGETNDQDNDDILREKIMQNLEGAIANRNRETAVQMSQIAGSAGKMKLLEDTSADLGRIVISNSMVLKGITEQMKKMRGGETS